MRISFHGAAGGVTGSCHLLEGAGKRILVDCGMFQGSRALDQENAVDFGFDPAGIDLVLLTHAHLDHCGRIPLLYKRGYRGRVLTNPPTAELARLVLMDAAGLQREELRRRLRYPNHNHNGANPAGPHGAAAPGVAPGENEPLYETADVDRALTGFDTGAGYGRSVDLYPGVHARFGNAGHILGSSWIHLQIEEAGRARSILFSGDLGNRDHPIIDPPDPPAATDTLVVECTYGDRNHKSFADTVAEFERVVTATLQSGGNVIIPTFALERAQVLLYCLHPMVDRGLIPHDTPLYLDSPMAIAATAVFERHAEYCDAATRAQLRAGHDPFSLPGLHCTRDTEASKAINAVRGGAVIMAGSGMAAGGRVLHHLRHNLGRPECSVIFVGYAGRGTLARQIIDGARQVRMFGETIAVAARIHTIGGFSAHADRDELRAWAEASQATRILLVHGEPEGAAAMQRDLATAGRSVAYPARNTVIEL